MNKVNTKSNLNDEVFEEILIADFLKAKREFLIYLKSNKNRSELTCYNYSSDLNIWSKWLNDNWLDWKECKPIHVERFVQTLVKEGIGPHGISRRISCLASFYRWAKKTDKVTEDPVYAIDKPKHPRRIPVWLEENEQNDLNDTLNSTKNIPENIFGRKPEYFIVIRKKYKLLFSIIQKTGLRIAEALNLKTNNIRIVNGMVKGIRVIGKGNKERIVPVPESLQAELLTAINKKDGDAYLFPGKNNKKPLSQHAARAYLHGIVDKTSISKKITPHKLRHTYATRLMEKGVGIVDIQALLGHESIMTTQIYTHSGQERLSKLVEDL